MDKSYTSIHDYLDEFTSIRAPRRIVEELKVAQRIIRAHLGSGGYLPLPYVIHWILMNPSTWRKYTDIFNKFWNEYIDKLEKVMKEASSMEEG